MIENTVKITEFLCKILFLYDNYLSRLFSKIIEITINLSKSQSLIYTDFMLLIIGGAYGDEKISCRS